MELDAIKTKWFKYSQNISFRDETEYRLAMEAFKSAYVDAYVTGHNIGKVEGIANNVIDKAMKYD